MMLDDDLKQGHVATGTLGRVGLRRISRMWWNPASGHFVADTGGCFMWSDSTQGPWRIVSGTVAKGGRIR